MKVKFDGTIKQITNFVNLTTNFNGNVDIKKGRWTVDASSIMGVLSLDLTQEAELIVENCEEKDLEKYLTELNKLGIITK